MHAQVNVPLPAYDDKTDAVLLYSETDVTVVSADKIKTTVREAYKILRPDGRGRGVMYVNFNPEKKIKSLHGWCIPAQGKDFEVKDKDAIEVSPDIEGAELISDEKYKVLRIPAADPEISSATNMKSKNGHFSCRTGGSSRNRTRCGRAITRCNYQPVGSSRRRG